MTVLSKAMVFAFLLVGVSAPSAVAQTSRTAPSSERLLDLSLADGGHQRVLLDAPLKPKAVIVMLPGGSGDIGLRRDGDVRHDDNFVVRTRELWTAQGYAVVIPDTVDRANLRGLRSSPEYARLVDGLIGFAHEQVGAPVFLLGTSQGSIAAMNGAAHAPHGSLAGVILTESVSVMGGSHETVGGARSCSGGCEPGRPLRCRTARDGVKDRRSHEPQPGRQSGDGVRRGHPIAEGLRLADPSRLLRH
jgi:pimeloyl-ACP methyl ester carboxylesterase